MIKRTEKEVKMTKKIKFRAYDKDLCKYITGAEFGLARMQIHPDEDESNRFSFDTLFPGRYTWERYTGLNDKNGKEIYEGDIVKGRWYRAKHARFNVLGEVMFAGCAFKVKASSDGEDRDGVFLYSCYDIEVIGNIHENPELLEGQE